MCDRPTDMCMCVCVCVCVCVYLYACTCVSEHGARGEGGTGRAVAGDRWRVNSRSLTLIGADWSAISLDSAAKYSCCMIEAHGGADVSLCSARSIRDDA